MFYSSRLGQSGLTLLDIKAQADQMGANPHIRFGSDSFVE